ncbi:MAG: 4-hydroxythreonine-4-phosphate dehydrogenase PdxA [Armatimonadota bacterium]
MSKKPIIGITLGDPAGIGPEIVLGALESEEVYQRCVPVVIGHAGVLRRCAEAVGKKIPIEIIGSPGEASGVFGTLEVVHVETPGMQDIEPGKLSADAGRAANAFIKKACELGLAGEIDAIATTPINKESLRLAGIEHIGHTEMLAAYLDSPDPLTLFITENMRIFFLSRHLSLKKAIDYINVERIHTFIRLVHEAMAGFGFENPTIGLAALNPHASDGGQFGDEEEKYLAPAVQLALEDGIRVSDPIGADSVFNMALEGKFDCVISLYHDQGHIAAKTRDFYGTVTATLNLPVLRTSVDHGTALDIAWKGIANPVSMKAAILAAVDMLERG